MNPIEKTGDVHIEDLTRGKGDAKFDQVQSVAKRNIFRSKSGLLIGATLVIVASFFMQVKKASPCTASHCRGARNALR